MPSVNSSSIPKVWPSSTLTTPSLPTLSIASAMMLPLSSSAAELSAAEEELCNIIADAIDKVGKDGVVNVEEGQTFGMELEFTEGMQFDKGYISPYMVTDQDRMEAVLEDPYILMANRRVGSLQDLLPVLEKVIQAGKPLLVIAEDV